jgi:2-(1,2-epoxy-1,2-dihydrophenyl)acetyl-CoA isomerase
MDSRIRVDIDDGLGTITLAAPERLNAFDGPMVATLAGACAALAADTAVRAILIAAEGRGFCAGLDLKWAAQQETSMIETSRQVITDLHGTITELRRAPKPVVTAVHGPAAGAGVGLALAGDVVLASSDARFSLAYSKIGLAPDGGTTYALPRLVGEKRALALFFSGDAVPADEAKAMGLVTDVLPAEDFDQQARAYANKLAHGPTLAYALAKQLVLDSLREGLETQMEKERHAITRTFASQDYRNGVAAFFRKEAATFGGN